MGFFYKGDFQAKISEKVLQKYFKGIVNLFYVTIEKYILLLHLRKRRSLSA